jgi:hypothetical protein
MPLKCACCTREILPRDKFRKRPEGGVLCMDCWATLNDDMDYSGSASVDQGEDDDTNNKD